VRKPIGMNMIDLLIGVTLMNAMPHYVLGVWKAKMLSGFGTGNLRNILWGLCNFAVSIGLFLYRYGFNGLVNNAIYLGACIVLVTFFITSFGWYRYYYK
jgi:hypothetical protein